MAGHRWSWRCSPHPRTKAPRWARRRPAPDGGGAVTPPRAVRDRAAELVRQELAVRLSHGHDAILRSTADLYRKIIGEALAADPATGKAGQTRAAQRALDRIAHLGVVDFVDQAGRRWTMQSYVEMAVRTAA